MPDQAFDYFALGDWHGTKQVGPKAWYAGTPELDRFPKGASNDPGHVLIVDVERAAPPHVTQVRTAQLAWHELSHVFVDDAGVDRLADRVHELLGGRTRLEKMLESWQARLLRMKLSNQTIVAPTQEEMEALTRRAEDPLISRVALNLVKQAEGTSEKAVIARLALRQLHALCQSAGTEF